VDLLAAGVLAITLGAVVVRQLRTKGIPVWILIGLGALGMVLVGGLPAGNAVGSLVANGPILVFLLALFLFVAELERAGAFDHLSAWIAERAPRPEELPMAFFVGLGLLSAFVVNDALVLVGVPVLIRLAARLRVPPVPLLLTLAFSVSVGSALTPFGNPQDLLVSLESGLVDPVTTFLRYLLVPTLASLAVGGLYVRWAFGREMGGATAGAPVARRSLWPAGRGAVVVARAPVLVIFPATLVLLLGSDLVGSIAGLPTLPLYLVALGGAGLVLLLASERTQLLVRVDWTVLALFAGLFVLVAGAVHGGVVLALESHLAVPGPNDPGRSIPLIVAGGVLGSQFVSNVPWVGLQIPVLHAAGYGGSAPWAWVALSAASTLAGNVTLLGAASNLIVVEQAERAGVRIDLRSFVRFGLPIALASIGILTVCLWAGL